MHFHTVSWINWTPTFSPRLGTPRFQEFRRHGGSSGVAVSRLGPAALGDTLLETLNPSSRALTGPQGWGGEETKDQRWFLVCPLLEGSRKDEKRMSCSCSWCNEMKGKGIACHILTCFFAICQPSPVNGWSMFLTLHPTGRKTKKEIDVLRISLLESQASLDSTTKKDFVYMQTIQIFDTSMKAVVFLSIQRCALI